MRPTRVDITDGENPGRRVRHETGNNVSQNRQAPRPVALLAIRNLVWSRMSTSTCTEQVQLVGPLAELLDDAADVRLQLRSMEASPTGIANGLFRSGDDAKSNSAVSQSQVAGSSTSDHRGGDPASRGSGGGAKRGWAASEWAERLLW